MVGYVLKVFWFSKDNPTDTLKKKKREKDEEMGRQRVDKNGQLS